MENEKFQELVLEQLKALTVGQTRLEGQVTGIEQGQEALIEGQGRLEARVGNLETGQLRIETQIENDVVEKIRALFDDRSMNQDYFASIRDAVGRVENRVEFLARQNIEHLDKMREHDRELRLLRAEKK